MNAFPQKETWWPTSYFELAQIFGVPAADAAKRVQELAQANVLRLAGPFSKHGYFLLKPPEPQKWQKYLETRYDEGMERLQAMVQYCQTASCRRKFILDYFGEKYDRAKCDSCDNCSREMIVSEDNTILVQKILSCVVRMQQRWGVTAVAEVLSGSRAERATRFSKLTTYGILSQYGIGELKREIRRTVAGGYLELSTGKYPTLSVTASGWQVLKGEKQAALPEPEEDLFTQKRYAESHFDTQLFEVLRNLRTSLARSRNVPPYVIFADKTLKEMSTFYPVTESEFARISGIGQEKMKTLVPKFMKIIRKYVDQHREEIKNAPSPTSPKWRK